MAGWRYVVWTCTKIESGYVVRCREGLVKATGRSQREAVGRALALAGKKSIGVRIVSGDRIVEPAAQGISVFVDSPA